MKSKLESQYRITFGVLIALLICPLILIVIAVLKSIILVSSLGLLAVCLFILPLIIFIIISLITIPRIEIIDGIVTYRQRFKIYTFDINEITDFVKVDRKINSWYTARGGLNIVTNDRSYEFPFHLYTNQHQLLCALRGVDYEPIFTSTDLRFSYVRLLRYVYRAPIVIMLLISLILLFVLLIKQAAFAVVIIFASLSALCIYVSFKALKYVKLSSNHLIHISPLQLRGVSINVQDVIHADPRPVYTGRTRIRCLTLDLNNGEVLSLRGELNSQSELEAIAREINEKRFISS